jgi:hypothetical protein
MQAQAAAQNPPPISSSLPILWLTDALLHFHPTNQQASPKVSAHTLFASDMRIAPPPPTHTHTPAPSPPLPTPLQGYCAVCGEWVAGVL